MTAAALRPATISFPALSPHYNELGSMSSADYAKRYADARRQAAALSASARAKLRTVYLEAAREAAEVVRTSLERGLSELTVGRWADIAAQLNAAADAIARGTESIGKTTVANASPIITKIDSDYVLAAAAKAGAGGIVTRAALARMVTAVNQRVVASVSTRLWSDGYNFSSRVWSGVRSDWLERMKNTVAAGIAQGRDPVKIAKDIQVYTADGKVALVKRWGSLERGTAEFAARLPGAVDWRAVRLVRSELYASLQDASVMAGQMNPGCTGMYDWVLSPGRQHWECSCEELAAGGPYKEGEVPSYPHPHCTCSVRPRLMDRAQFVADLKRWADGESVDYLDAWNTKWLKAAGRIDA